MRQTLVLVVGILLGLCVALGARGDEQACDATAAAAAAGPRKPVKFIVSSHNRLFVHDVATGKHRTLHTGSGVYYSVFESDAPNKLWVATRPDKGGDSLFEVDLRNPPFEIEQKFALPSKFTHEVIRYKNRVYVADTSSGTIIELSYPDFKEVTHISKFTGKDHINTLAIDDDGGSIWAVFHNRHAPSFVVKFNTTTGEIIQEIRNFANQAHGWIEYPRGSKTRVVLSSGDASLIYFDTETEKSEVLYRSPQHSAGQRMFLKGLTVVDDFAYFGESEFRDRAGRAEVECSLIAFDLKNKKVVFERKYPGSIGLINTISVMGVKDSTYRAVDSTSIQPDDLDDSTQCDPAYDAKIQYVRSVVTDARKTGLAYGTFPNDVDVIRLPFNFDVEELQEEVKNLVERHGGWVERKDVNNWFILLVTKDGNETDQSTFGPFDEVGRRLWESPIVRRLFRKLGVVVGRTRLMMLKPGENVIAHVDKTHHTKNGVPDISGGYWGRRFRIHVPIFTDPQGKVKFSVGRTSLHFKAGAAYVFDNAKPHAVANDWDQERVHLVIDTLGGPRLFESILRNSEARFYPSRGSIPKFRTMKDSLFPLVDMKTSLVDRAPVLKERFIDEAVFEPMKISTVEMYLVDHVLKNFVRDMERPKVKQIFDRFLYIWSRTPRELDIWGDLLDPVMCSGVMLNNGLELVEAVEPLARILHYQCNRDSKNRASEHGPPCRDKAKRQ